MIGLLLNVLPDLKGRNLSHGTKALSQVLWDANIPSYVADRDIEVGGEITAFRTLREKNIALVFADLKRGENELIFRSTKPSEHIRIKSIGRVGQRYEVWIENDAEAAQLHTIRIKLEPGLKIGGFWWDGFYSRSIFRYGWGGYDRETGELDMRCFYPVTLKINTGLTRFSVELR